MAYRNQNDLPNRERTVKRFQDFSPLDEMKSALECTVDSIDTAMQKSKSLFQMFPDYLSGDPQYLKAGLKKEDSSKMLDDMKNHTSDLLDEAFRQLNLMTELVHELESSCDNPSVLSERLNVVAVLHDENQKLKDKVTLLMYNLENIYGILLTDQAKRKMVQDIKSFLYLHGDAFASLEYAANCARTSFIGIKMLQTVSRGVQEMANKLKSNNQGSSNQDF